MSGKRGKVIAGLEDGGGIGNELFNYASSFSIARANNLTMFYYDNNKLQNVLSVTAALISQEMFTRFKGAVKHKKVRHNGYDESMFNISHDKDTKIAGYLQSWMYFKQYIPEIRREFRFKEHIIRQAQEVLFQESQRFRNAHSILTFVGVHVRRGDILKDENVAAGYVQPPVTYYYTAMDYFLKLSNGTRNVVFVYCSDDINWVRKTMDNVTEKYNMAFIKEKNPGILDLAILSSCNHTIISTGTFGWWAAFLAGGKNIHYRYVARNGSRLRSHYSADLNDYWYPGWRSME